YEVQLLELRQPLDQPAHFRAEQFVDLGASSGSILDRVVQKRSGYRRLVHAPVGEDRGNFERMGEVRIAGSAPLVPMLLPGIDIGLVEQRLVNVGLVALDALDRKSVV